jgi:hypothetical protein
MHAMTSLQGTVCDAPDTSNNDWRTGICILFNRSTRPLKPSVLDPLSWPLQGRL